MWPCAKRPRCGGKRFSQEGTIFIRECTRPPRGPSFLFERASKTTLTGRRRVDVPCESLGFTPPPHRLDVLFLRGAGPLALLVHSPVGRLLEVERWLVEHRPLRMRSAGGLDPHVLRAEFEEVPSSWDELLAGAKTRSLHLSTAGIATWFLDPGEGVATLSRPATSGGVEAHVRGARAGGVPSDGLTDRQIDALSLAVSLGYYEVPHRVSQRELARRLDMSLSGLSRLLRRAEASVIAVHMDAMVDAGAEGGRFGPFMDAAETKQGHPDTDVRLAHPGTKGRPPTG